MYITAIDQAILELQVSKFGKITLDFHAKKLNISNCDVIMTWLIVFLSQKQPYL